MLVAYTGLQLLEIQLGEPVAFSGGLHGGGGVKEKGEHKDGT